MSVTARRMISKRTTNKHNIKENNTMEILSEFIISGKKYCTVKTKGGVSVMEKWEYNNAKSKYMKTRRK